MLDKFFELQKNGTTVRTEVMAGVTTFLTMAYIILVNPQILSTTGMDTGAVFVATCLAAAIGTAIMGFYANYPVAQAPGMGLNAYFAFGVVGAMGISWQVGLGAVFISGVLFFLISIFKLREWVINAIPRGMKMGIAAGIGLFLGLIALKSANIIVANPATFVAMGDLTSIPILLAVLGFFAIVAMHVRRIPGAIILGILGITLIGLLLGQVKYGGIVSMPPSLTPTFMQMDVAGALSLGLVTIIFAFLFVDLFDTAGTLVGVAHRGKMLDAEGKLPRLGRALTADSTATMVGAALGTSTTTSYIESAAGVDAGGRTGLTAVTVAGLFLLALFFSPLASMIPPFATAPALFFVACLMASSLRDVNWDDLTEYAPAFITAFTMPLTFSIAHGIGLGFISFVAIKLLAGKTKDISIAAWIIAALFLIKLIIA